MATGDRSVNKSERALIERLLAQYVKNRNIIEVMLKQVSEAIHGSQELMKHVHSTKSRLKDPTHLRDKLIRKLVKLKEQRRTFPITESNLFRRVNDLAGFRILHLNTNQIVAIDRELRAVFQEYRWPLTEKPTARTWDDEYRQFFERMGLRTTRSPTLYTSVHYVIESNNVNKGRCEIQVRTLAEELWGEVDHSMNYPRASPVASCREQIKVLARLTSTCSRLVDSIYETSIAGGRRGSRVRR